MWFGVVLSYPVVKSRTATTARPAISFGYSPSYRENEQLNIARQCPERSGSGRWGGGAILRTFRITAKILSITSFSLSTETGHRISGQGIQGDDERKRVAYEPADEVGSHRAVVAIRCVDIVENVHKGLALRDRSSDAVKVSIGQNQYGGATIDDFGRMIGPGHERSSLALQPLRQRSRHPAHHHRESLDSRVLPCASSYAEWLGRL